MASTDVAAVANQIEKFWAPMFTKELRENLLLGSLVNRDYEGDMKTQGDTVYVSQINAPTGQLLTVGTNANTFSPEAVSMTRIEIKANKRAVASFEIEDLAKLQSQLDSQDSEIRTSLMYSMSKQINDYLYTLVAPSASGPDHILNTVTNFNSSQLSTMRKLAAKAKWPTDGKGWWVLADPSYYSNLLDDTTLSNVQYGATDAPIIGGQLALKRYGFNVLEDNSRPDQTAIAFHPDFMHLCVQQQAQVKLSDLHSNNKFSYLLSVDLIFGAALGISGDKKCIKVIST